MKFTQPHALQLDRGRASSFNQPLSVQFSSQLKDLQEVFIAAHTRTHMVVFAAESELNYSSQFV